MAGRTVVHRRLNIPRLPTAGIAMAWGLALITYGLGDGVTTLAVVASPHHVETNPIVAAAIGTAGGVGLLAVKAGVLGGCVALSIWMAEGDRTFSYWPPILLVAVGAATTLSNITLLA
ncbi:MAG: hypothetical protein ABEH42_12650 [Haloarculaceae archaeon]